MTKMITVDADLLARRINALECNHICAKMAVDAGDWEKHDLWMEWRQEEYKALQEMGIPVYNPRDDRDRD